MVIEINFTTINNKVYMFLRTLEPLKEEILDKLEDISHKTEFLKEPDENENIYNYTSYDKCYNYIESINIIQKFIDILKEEKHYEN